MEEKLANEYDRFGTGGGGGRAVEMPPYARSAAGLGLGRAASWILVRVGGLQDLIF